MNNYSVFTGEIKMYKKFSLVSLLIISVSIAAYEPYGPHTSDKWQIWAYSSAAPLLLVIMLQSWPVEKLLEKAIMAGHVNLKSKPYPEKGWKNPQRLWQYVMTMRA